ncbi:MAG TPA: hypothetical protein VFP23_10505, partial [Solirubrobacterales bacterium]|nr:hypothetical protein [Solirubrobacterales bacterium]
ADRVLQGAVYLAKQTENPFGSLLALYLVVEDEQSGTIIKLAGKAIANQATGQLETVFDENPQLPFEHLRLHLAGGPRAALKNPPACGHYATQATLSGWSGAQLKEESSFQIDKGPAGGPCPTAAFAPHLEAGTENPLAGSFSPLHLRLAREDGEALLGALKLTLPPGLSGSLRNIPYCPEEVLASISPEIGSGLAQEQSPSCPKASQIGTLTSAAGAGPDPFFTQSGRIYLAGPYQGAPLSIAAIAPAVAGPFDLGSVVVRNALRIDPETAQISAVSDPFPTILHGIPLDLRDIRVDLNRPSFTLNPTSCEPMQIASQISSPSGQAANPSVHFQAAACGQLAFKPKLSLSLKGKTARRAHPALRALLTMPAQNQANIARAEVTLPHAEFLDQGHIQNVCTQVQFKAAGCPQSSILGYAKAETPLLDHPLEGPVYLMSGFGHKLPDLAADLNGQIRVLLHGKVDSGPGGGIRTTFEVIPDAPVTKFTISLKGGAKGLIQNSEDLCAKPGKALAQFTAQNGKVSDTEPVLKTAGCKGKGHKGHGRHSRARRR